MVTPVPGYGISTPYGKRGSYWGCNRDSSGNGIHTGADFAAPAGSQVVAARGGKAVYCNHGSSFGYHQIEVLPGDGTRDFYAHMPSRAVPDGGQVTAGQQIGKVGAEGNVTGPHLHFERHKVATGGWSCAIVTNPQPSIDYQPASSGGSGASGKDEDVPKFSRTRLTKPVQCGAGEWVTLVWDKVSSGQAGKAGEAPIYIGPSPYTATLVATISATGEVCRTRFLERTQENGKWVTADAYPALEHPLTSGKTYVSDTRTQNVAKGDRLTVQVNLPNGGVVESAELNCLYF